MTYATLPAERVKAACEATLQRLGEAAEGRAKVSALKVLAEATMVRGGTNAVVIDLPDFGLIYRAYDLASG